MDQSSLNLAINEAVFSYCLMAVIAGIAALLIRGIVIGLAAIGKKAAVAKPTPVIVSVTPARDESKEVAAAIAAAVYATLGAHRLVYIGEAQRGVGWTGEIRSRLHTAHRPRQDHH
jgi:hypothetical protein